VIIIQTTEKCRLFIAVVLAITAVCLPESIKQMTIEKEVPTPSNKLGLGHLQTIHCKRLDVQKYA
jgi:hypothetical protein